ncbi:PiggyBac transposable element-derived protein 4 [Orchesella cincta]|uniref:PiggyBac transposable element-derived protein 4 n=1 Tax=Orchesella cincta TaxID=48709 RepID=A0A1D2M5M5_ORCCI|nr:PiggyBac transposable element-derived protein 4 [Orchesella cincta]
MTHWCQNPIYRSAIVPTIMTSDRYKEVHKYLHFCNNDEQEEGDRLHKINQLWQMVNANMQRMFRPGRNVCVDESLVLFKGKLFWKQYIPNKASKFGMKIFSIGDSDTGYILFSIIYRGAGHEFMFPKEKYGFVEELR